MDNKNIKRAVGILPEGQIHWLDHLAVICQIMHAPLVFFSEEEVEVAKRIYPKLASIYDPEAISDEYIFSKWDVFYSADPWNYQTFRMQRYEMEKKFGKILRKVYVPHGFSDKSAYMQRCVEDDISLIYGQNMLDQLKLHGVYDKLTKFAITGNYRYPYYRQHKEFLDKLAHEDVFQYFLNEQTTVIYAPTWMGLEEGSSFFEACETIIEALPHDINLLVKLHPRLEQDDIANFYRILGKYEFKPNVRFVDKYPLIYPLLAKSDAFIGDISSVGYDFLPFNKPMLFLNRYNRDWRNDPGVFLHRCGVQVSSENYSKIFDIMKESLAYDQERFTEIRKKVYDYTFGEEVPFADIKKTISDVIETSEP